MPIVHSASVFLNPISTSLAAVLLRKSFGLLVFSKCNKAILAPCKHEYSDEPLESNDVMSGRTGLKVGSTHLYVCKKCKNKKFIKIHA